MRSRETDGAGPSNRENTIHNEAFEALVLFAAHYPWGRKTSPFKAGI